MVNPRLSVALYRVVWGTRNGAVAHDCAYRDGGTVVAPLRHVLPIADAMAPRCTRILDSRNRPSLFGVRIVGHCLLSGGGAGRVAPDC